MTDGHVTFALSEDTSLWDSDEAPVVRSRPYGKSATVADWGLELILRWIHDATCKVDLVAGLDAALEAFDHFDDHEHDREIQGGAVDAILESLVIVLQDFDDDDDDEEEDDDNDNVKSKPPMEKIVSSFQSAEMLSRQESFFSVSQDPAEQEVERSEVIAKCVSALEMLHRCSFSMLSTSFHDNLKPLLPMLLQIISEFSFRMVEDDWAYHCVHNAVEVLRYFTSISPEAHRFMGGHHAYFDTLTNLLDVADSISGPLDEVNGIFREVLIIFGTFPLVDRMYNHPFLFHKIIEKIGNNSKVSDPAREAAVNFFDAMASSGRGRLAMPQKLARNAELISFITNVMLDERTDNEEANWVRCKAVKLAHKLCIPKDNADILFYFQLQDTGDNKDEVDHTGEEEKEKKEPREEMKGENDSHTNSEEKSGTDEEPGDFVRALIQLVIDGSESFSAACALCHLAGNLYAAKTEFSRNPILLDTMSKMALSNPNVVAAAEAVQKVLPITPYPLFRSLVLLLSLDPQQDIVAGRSIESNDLPNALCLQIAINSINDRLQESIEIRRTIAMDECMIMIVSKAAKSADTYGSKNMPKISAAASAAIKHLSAIEEGKEKLLDDPDTVSALAKVIHLSEVKLNTSSHMKQFHEASANATCAICNLAVDDDSNEQIFVALNGESSLKKDKKHRQWRICSCRSKLCHKMRRVIYPDPAQDKQ